MALTDIKNPYSHHSSVYDDGIGASSDYDAYVKSLNNSVEVPDPSEYLFGSKSKKYKAALNQYNHDMERYRFDAELAIMADDRAYAEEIYNKYNSPEAQARQMRAAGLNPDLQGIESQGMTAPQASMPNTGVPVMNNDNQSLAYDFLMAIPQAVSMFTGMAGSIQSLKAGKLALSKQVDDIALNFLGGVLQPEHFDDKYGSTDELISKFTGKGKKITQSVLAPKYGRRMAKRIAESVSNYVLNDSESVRGAVYSKHFSGENSRQGFLNLLGNYGFSVDDDIFVDVIKEFNNALKLSSYSKNKFDSDYWSTRNGVEAGETDNTVKSKQGMQADNDIFTELMSKANRKMNSENNKEVAVGVLMYIALLLTNAGLSKKGLNIQE